MRRAYSSLPRALLALRRALIAYRPRAVFSLTATIALVAVVAGPIHGHAGRLAPIPPAKLRHSEKSVGATSKAAVLESSFWSASLGRDMQFAVYLPPGYESSKVDRYPVLYMLHGLGGDHDEWQRYGLFDQASTLIEAGEIPPLIIVTPDGYQGYWVDHANGGERFGSYVSKDLVSYIDRTYRTVPNPDARAIGGMSMGAHGALQLALNNPGEFSIVGAHSLVLRTHEQAFAFFGDATYFAAHDPVSIFRKNPKAGSALTLEIDIGAADGWEPAALAFHQQLTAERVPHKWNVAAGGHDAAYWSSHIPDYLRFYGRAFLDRQYAAEALAQ